MIWDGGGGVLPLPPAGRRRGRRGRAGAVLAMEAVRPAKMAASCRRRSIPRPLEHVGLARCWSLGRTPGVVVKPPNGPLPLVLVVGPAMIDVPRAGPLAIALRSVISKAAEVRREEQCGQRRSEFGDDRHETVQGTGCRESAIWIGLTVGNRLRRVERAADGNIAAPVDRERVRPVGPVVAGQGAQEGRASPGWCFPELSPLSRRRGPHRCCR